MKHLTVIGLLHLVNCVTNTTNSGVATVDIVSDCDNSDKQIPGRFSELNLSIKARPRAQVPNFVLFDADILDSDLKICMRDPLKLKALFINNSLECDLLLTKEFTNRNELVQYSKDILVDFFRLPYIEHIYEINQLPDDQFKKHLNELLSRIWINPRYASQGGKKYIRDVVAGGYYGIEVVKVMVEYYWAVSSFRDVFLDRAFETLAKSMPMRDYFELEHLLNWFQIMYDVWGEEQWIDLMFVVRRHYAYPANSSIFKECWYKARPLYENPTQEIE